MADDAAPDKQIVFFGSHAVDNYFQCAFWPVEGQKINAVPTARVYGGMIPNAATIFAGYGISPILMGPLEDNEDADSILAEMREAGVDAGRVRRSSEFRNSSAFNFLTDANPDEKTLVIVDPGYRFRLNDDEEKVFTGADFIYSTIAHLARIENIVELLGHARRNGARLFIDVEAESFRSAREDWWAFSVADFLSFNDESLTKFCRSSDPDESIARVMSATGGEVITTLGAAGVRVSSEYGSVHVPGMRVKSVDALGAGDTFNASYLFGRATGWCIERAARFANAAAARSTTMIGPRSGRASIETVLAFQNGQPTTGRVQARAAAQNDQADCQN